MLWIKAFHIIFLVSWFAGLLYLPRLFVYQAGTRDEISHTRFLVMEHKLFASMTIGAVLTAIFGLWLLADYAWAAYRHTGWLTTRLLLAGLLVSYHISCALLMRDFRLQCNRHSQVYCRWYNEVPAILLIAIVLLAVTKPF